MEEDAGGIERKASWLDLIADPVRLEILRALDHTPEVTVTDVVNHGAASEPTVRRHLNALVNLGLIQRDSQSYRGGVAGRPSDLFRLSPEIRDSVHVVLEIVAKRRYAL